MAAFPLAWFVLTHWPAASIWPAVAVLALALTDWIDGALARLLDAKSDLGAWLDPMADKVLVFAVGGAAVVATGFAWWMLVPFIAMTGRDALMSFKRASPQAATNIPVSFLGKAKTWVTMAALIGLVLPPAWGIFWAALGLYWVAAVMSLWSAWGYLRP